MFSAISRLATGNTVLDVTLACGGLALGVTLLLVIQVLLLRWQGQRQRARRARVVATWRPLLLAAASGEPVTCPVPRRSERGALLLLWNQLQESLRGSAHAALNRLAADIGLLRNARRDLLSRTGRRQLMALATLAHVGHPADWPLLRKLLDDSRWFVGMAAARAMLRIDAGQAAPMVIDRFLARSDWPLARLGTLLRESGAQAAAPVLAQRLEQGGATVCLRLLPLASMILTGAQEGVVERILVTSDDPAVLAAALPQIHGPFVLPRVRRLCVHPDPDVRTQAANALGRLGSAADRPRLMAMLSDRQWWVRYRAAHALLALPGARAEEAVTLCTQLQDRYARDILAQAAAERALRARAP